MMYLTKKGNLDYQLISKTIQDTIAFVQDKVSNEPEKLYHQDSDGNVHEVETLELPLDIILEYEYRKNLRQICKALLKSQKLIGSVTEKFTYYELLSTLSSIIISKRLSSEEVLDINSLLENLINSLNEETRHTKMIIIPVLGASLEKGEVCNIGGVKFVTPANFIEMNSHFFDPIRNDQQFSKIYNFFSEACQKSDLIALVNIKNKSADISKEIASEIMKRIYAIVQFLLPTCGGDYSFFGALGEEYLDQKFSFMLAVDASDESIPKSIKVDSSKNYFVRKGEINLLEQVSNLRQTEVWFNRCYAIIEKFVDGNKLSSFEERIWTALYWLGAAMNEKEISPLIIQYATCLEALFNNQEGGISQQVPEFAAHVVGNNKKEKMEVYQTIRELYKLRSDAVHGRSMQDSLDDEFLFNVKEFCNLAVFRMAVFSGVEDFPIPGGYKGFVNYILEEHRFSN